MEKLFYKLGGYFIGACILGLGCFYLDKGLLGGALFNIILGTLILKNFIKIK